MSTYVSNDPTKNRPKELKSQAAAQLVNGSGGGGDASEVPSSTLYVLLSALYCLLAVAALQLDCESTNHRVLLLFLRTRCRSFAKVATESLMIKSIVCPLRRESYTERKRTHFRPPDSNDAADNDVIRTYTSTPSSKSLRGCRSNRIFLPTLSSNRQSDAPKWRACNPICNLLAFSLWSNITLFTVFASRSSRSLYS